MRKACILLVIVVVSACAPQDDSWLVGQLASDRVELSAEFTETVLARHIVEGEKVSAGTLLLEQDPARIAVRIQEADAAIAEAKARLAELTRGPRREQIAAARAAVRGAGRDVEFRTLEYNRAREVLERQLAAPESVDRAKAALDAAESQLAIQEARLAELLTGTTVEELQQAEAQLAVLRARRAQLELDRSRLHIAAPVDATLDSWLIEVGERPLAGQPLATLLTGVQPYARIYVPEELRINVTPGAAAEVRVDGRTTVLQGRVRWVASEAAFTPFFALTEHDRGRLTYLAKIDLDTDGARLPDGIPVQVRVVGAARQ